MAPSILQLEITRISRMLPSLNERMELHNAMVQARFSLTRFLDELSATQQPPLGASCIDHLRKALLAVSFHRDESDSNIRSSIEYILDRLQYVYNRISLIYT